MKNIGNILIFNRFDKIQFSLRFEENQYSIPVSSTKKSRRKPAFFVLGTLRCLYQTPSKPPLRGRLSRFAPKGIWVRVDSLYSGGYSGGSGSRAVSGCGGMGAAAGWRLAVR